MAVQLTSKQTAQLKMAFSALDKDRHGTISSKHLAPLLRAVDVTPTAVQLATLTRELEARGMRAVDFPECLKFVSRYLPEPPAAVASKAGGRSGGVDTTAGGSGPRLVTPAELRALIAESGQELSPEQLEEIDELILEAEVDCEGKINYDEFVDMMWAF